MRSTLQRLTLTASLLATTPLYASDTVKVVVDIAPLHSLVAGVMDGVGEPTLLIEPGASPHSYSMRPSQAAALQNAGLVVWMGPELAPWLEDALDNVAGSTPKLTALEAEGTRLLNYRDLDDFGSSETSGDHDHNDDDHGHDKDDDHAHDDHDHDKHEDEHAHDDHDHGHDDHKDEDHAHDDHDHEGHEDEEHAHDDHGHDDHKDEEHAHDDHGHDDHKDEEHAHDDHDHDDHKDEEHAHDDHGHDHAHDHDGVDPHAWLDPANAKVWVSAIATALAEADPDHSDAYWANASKSIRALDALTLEIEAKLATAPDRPFVVQHDAYQYFESRFGLTAAGSIASGDAEQASAARIAILQEQVAEQGVNCMLTEPQYDADLANSIASGAELQVGLIDPLGVDQTVGPDLYAGVLRAMAEEFAECL